MDTLLIEPKKLKPMWLKSPKRFEAIHKSLIIFELQKWDTAGKTNELSKFIAAYLKDLPANLPSNIILEITNWVIFEWENWQANLQNKYLEPEMA
jgi:hypothetical protein